MEEPQTRGRQALFAPPEPDSGTCAEMRPGRQAPRFMPCMQDQPMLLPPDIGTLFVFSQVIVDSSF